MPTLTPPTQRRRPSRPPRTHLHRLLRRRDELADLIAARRSHALPSTDLWVGLVRLEDHLRETFPRAYAIHLPAWIQRQAPGTHPVGGTHPACPLCPDNTGQQAVQTGQTR